MSSSVTMRCHLLELKKNTQATLYTYTAQKLEVESENEKIMRPNFFIHYLNTVIGQYSKIMLTYRGCKTESHPIFLPPSMAISKLDVQFSG